MKSRQVFLGIALVVATAVITNQVVSQDHPKGDHPKKDHPTGDHPKKDHPQPPDMSPEMAELMQKWQEFATPGENHKVLERLVGDWTMQGQFWMEPDGDPMPMSGKANYTSIWEGRYITATTEGDPMPGEPPFHGLAGHGYDNLKKKFFWVWIDSMGTGVMHGEGDYDKATNTFKYSFDQPDLRKGKYVKGRSVEKWIDNDHFVAEWYGPDKNGKEYKSMEFKYSRAK